MIASTRDEREATDIRRITRRDFLKTAATGAVATGIAGVTARAFLRDLLPPVEAQKTVPIKSAVVIGSGFAGLTAAYLLSKMGKTVTVLEKCHRPGGRCQQHNYPDGTHAAISYSEFFNRKCNPDLWWLLSELKYASSDIAQFPWDCFYYWRGKYLFDKWTNLQPQLPWDNPTLGGYTDFRAFSDEVWASKAPFDVPHEATDYVKYDYTDLKDWILWKPDGTRHHRTDVEEFVNLNLKGETGGSNEWTSAGYGVDSWYWWEFSRFYELKHGNYGLIEALMSKLPPGTLHLNEEAKRVENTATGVEVETSGAKYKADAAIVAVDHPSVAGIVPELPTERKAALESMGAQKNIRIIAEFTEKYCETKYGMWGFGGYTDHNVTRGAYCVFHETVTQPYPRGVISMYINEPEATALWKPHKGIHVSKPATDELVAYFLDELEKFWPGAHDYYIPGSGLAFEWEPYGPAFKPSYVLDGTYARNRLPVGRIYFAGDWVYGFSGSEAVFSGREVVKNFT